MELLTVFFIQLVAAMQDYPLGLCNKKLLTTHMHTQTLSLKYDYFIDNYTFDIIIPHTTGWYNKAIFTSSYVICNIHFHQ